MTKIVAIVSGLFLTALASGCNPTGCGCGTPGIIAASTDMPTAGAPKRKMKVVQLRPDFKDNRPMPSGGLRPIDPNAKPPRRPTNPPSTDPPSTVE